ncbi:hypothetical protein NESM_000278200 [Novymonas esmeraldas]|uniref:rRNA biogenesis protein RRP36 n=1 Tax=Novymonas esmeraldas TaxID=1808958 RepID=A0AAW0F792_9TRYP
MSDDDDGGAPPPAQDAHRRPRRGSSHGSSAGPSSRVAAQQQQQQQQRPARVDPRFDSMFGRVDARRVEQNYAFLREAEAQEEVQRRLRIRCLKCVLRRSELEDAGEDLDEYDLSDYEREVFGEDHQRDLWQMKRTPPPHLYAELEQLQRASQLYTAKTRDATVKDRRSRVKQALMKKEVASVKAGVKAKPYFPKKAEVKRAVLADTFVRLNDKGGKAAVDRYVIRKRKK